MDILTKLDNYLINEAMPNLPGGIVLNLEIIKSLIYRKLGADSKWSETTFKPSNFREEDVALGVGNMKDVGKVTVAVIKDNNTFSAYVLDYNTGKEVKDVRYKKDYKAIVGAKSIISELEAIGVTVSTWYVGQQISMPSKSKWGSKDKKLKGLESDRVIKFAVAEVGIWLSNFLPKAKSEIMGGLIKDLDAIFSLLEATMKNPESNRDDVRNKLSKLVESLRNRARGIENFSEYIRNNFSKYDWRGEDTKNTNTLSHNDIKRIKEELDRAINGMSRW